MTPTLACGSLSRPPAILGALILAYVVLLPYQFQINRGLNFAPADIILLLILVLAADQLRYRKAVWTGWHFGIALVFCLGGFVTAFRFGGIDQYELLNKGAGLMLPFLSYFAITSGVFDWDDLRRILKVFTLGVVFENTLAVGAFLLAYFFGTSSRFTSYGGLRLSGLLLDANAYGGLLVAALVIIEGSSWGRAPLLRGVVLWFSRITLAVGILFTFSRSAWIALACALLLLCVIRTGVAIRIVVTGLLGVPFLFLLMGRRFLPIFEEMASRPKQVQGRFDLIRSALQAFATHPLIGGGLGSFRQGEGEIAHNSAMWFLADFGLIGLAVLLGFLGWFFAKGWYAYRYAPAREKPIVLALLLAHAAMLGLAMGIEAFYQRHWWMVFALIASGYCLALRRVNHPLGNC
jgi:O-antigen ligase